MENNNEPPISTTSGHEDIQDNSIVFYNDGKMNEKNKTKKNLEIYKKKVCNEFVCFLL